MPEVFLDTSVCIDYLQGSAGARRFLLALRGERGFIVHAVVAAELYEGMISKAEQQRVDAIVEYATLVLPTAHDLHASLKLLRRHRPAHGVDWHDCLIAATALRLGVPIATLNDKHFRVFKGLSVVRPYSAVLSGRRD